MAKFTLTVDKTKYRATEAKLYLSDSTREFSPEFNHPELSIALAHPSGADYDAVGVTVKFQRDNRRPEASSFMDTARQWTHCYASDVELQKMRYVKLIDAPHSPRHEDKVRIAFARKLARHIRKFNLANVHECEAQRVVRALEDMGVRVKFIYCDGRGNSTDVTFVHCWPDTFGANKRARKLVAKSEASHV